MAKKLSGYGITAGRTIPIDWKCDGCGWAKVATPLSPDPMKVPEDVQEEFNSHQCENYPHSPFIP